MLAGGEMSPGPGGAVEGQQVCPSALRDQSRAGHAALPELTFLSGCCRNLSEPVMTYKLHKELVLAASKSHGRPANTPWPCPPQPAYIKIT